MSRLVSEPAGTSWFPRIPPPFMIATSARSRARMTSVTRLPTFVSLVRSAALRASSGTRVSPIRTSSAVAEPALVAGDQRRHRRILRQLRRDRDEAVLASQHLAVPGRLEVDAHDEDAVGARLRDQRLPDDVLERVVLVAADDEVDAGHRPRHPLVGRHVLVRDRHHDRAAPGPEVGHGPRARGDGIAELDSRGPGSTSAGYRPR